MKRTLLATLVLATASQAAIAHCTRELPLEGTVIIPTCNTGSEGCEQASQLVADYAASPDTRPEVLSVALQTSPWRLYDGQLRILPPADLAAMLRRDLKPTVKRVELQGSWTGVAPGKGQASLARKLSEALDGFPVEGMDGFLWLKPDGTPRTTRQAFSAWAGGAYSAKRGDDVMTALTVGWPATMPERVAASKEPGLALMAAVGADVFSLCPDKALEGFELAASFGSAIGAYNAALFRLERAGDGDRAAAETLLQRAIELGDAKAASVLQSLRTPAA